MNYQVLARKWRPHNFTEVVGQDHVVKSLINGLLHNRLHHAYLFTGTRGVGKTTIARILAKAINCENLQDFNPCGVCNICRALDEGRFLDLIEVDAASRTKVEDTRDLLDNVQYAPSYGRYKVYIIDEVHMLSGHSFNALLKTLEEPPPHVKFLLATTDPHKIPVTVLSRCLQFNLKRLLPAQILFQMEFILQKENINFEKTALKLLSRAADGSMRDALSLLDQAIVYGNGSVSEEEVRAMLGTVAQQPVDEILIALAQNDASAVLNKINEIANLTPDFNDVLNQILQIFHRVALIQQVPTAIDHDFNNDLITTLSCQLSPEDVQLFYQIGLVGQRDLSLAPDLQSGFEMVMLRMLTFKPVSSSQSTVTINTTKQTTSTPPAIKKNLIETKQMLSNLNIAKNDWLSMIIEMKLTGATKEFANNCVLENIDEKTCTLIADPDYIKGSRTLDILETALQNFCDAPIKLIIKSTKTALETPAIQLIKEQEDKQQNSIKAINSDPNIQALKDHFNARVLPGTIKPL